MQKAIRGVGCERAARIALAAGREWAVEAISCGSESNKQILQEIVSGRKAWPTTQAGPVGPASVPDRAAASGEADAGGVVDLVVPEGKCGHSLRYCGGACAN